MMESKQIKNPFPGLRPFETDEYRLFFGREGQSDELLAKLQRAYFLAVVGTSGSGKSSLIRAGLLPALRGGMMAGAGSGWRVAVIRPGSDPIGNLAHELAKKDVLSEAGGGLREDETEAVIDATLRGGSLGLVDVARQGRLAEHEKLLVVVDQFEELFRFRAAQEKTSTGDEALAFVKLLIEASQQHEPPVYVLLTMRSDFLGDCAQFQGLPEAINSGQYLIPRMTRDERRFAVTGPIGVTRGRITEPLVNRLLNDVGDNPDQLPILQHALMRTWDHWATNRRNGEPIGVEHYEAIGTMSDALSLHADEAFNELPDERSRQIAERLFKALSERGPDNREIRRPTRLSEICEIAGASIEEVIAVIDIFRGGGRSFLMPPAGITLRPETVIDISHESLIRNWQRLNVWVTDEAQLARIYRRLAEAAVLHREGKEAFLQSPGLEVALEWREKCRPNAAWAQRYHPDFDTSIAYLNESLDEVKAANIAELAARAERERQREELLERERQQREQAELFAAAQARANRKLRLMMTALVALLLLALAMTGYAMKARADAVHSRDAEARTGRDAQESLQRLQETQSALVDKTNTAERNARNAELATDAAKSARHYAETQATRANTQAKLAASRLNAALKAQAEAKRELIAKNTEIQNDVRNREALAQLQRGNVTQAATAFEDLVKVYQSDPYPSRLAWARSHLGAAFRQLGRLDRSIEQLSEAQKIQTKAIEVDRVRPTNDPEYLDTLTWLAHAHSDKSEYNVAQPLYERVLEIRRLVSANDTDIAVSLENLARNYNKTGESEQAEKYYNESLNLRRPYRYSPDLIAALREVAEFQLEYGDPKAAIGLYSEALDHQAQLAPDDPSIAATFDGMARALEEIPKKKRADRLHLLAREIRRSRLAKDPDEQVTSLENLARRFTEDGRFDEAWRLRSRAARIFAEHHGAESQGTVNHIISLADFRRDTAHKAWTLRSMHEPHRELEIALREAEDSYNAALEMSRRKGFVAEEVRALDGLARLKRGGQEAESYYKQALEIRERKSDVDLFPEQAMIENLQNLAQAIYQEKPAEAEAYLLRALKIFDGMGEVKIKFLSGAHALDANILRHSTSARLAELYRSQRRFKEADEQYRPLVEKLKAIERKYLDAEYTSQTYLNIVAEAGRFYSSQGDKPAEESFYQLIWPQEVRPSTKVLVVWPEEIYAKSLMGLAPDSCVPQMIEILHSYASLLRRSGREKEAAEISFGVDRLKMRTE